MKKKEFFFLQIKKEIPEDSLIRQPVVEKPPTPVKKKITQTSPKKNFQKYPSPPFPKNEKLKAGEKVDLNRADTTLLKKVPGIGSAFARRIVGYRNLLGGFYSVEQLKEVYGMEEERFLQIEPFFLIDKSHIRQRKIDALSPDSLLKHPYLNYPRQRAITRKLKQQGQISGWEEFILLEEFTPDDIEKLKNYFSFN